MECPSAGRFVRLIVGPDFPEPAPCQPNVWRASGVYWALAMNVVVSATRPAPGGACFTTKASPGRTASTGSARCDSAPLRSASCAYARGVPAPNATTVASTNRLMECPSAGRFVRLIVGPDFPETVAPCQPNVWRAYRCILGPGHECGRIRTTRPAPGGAPLSMSCTRAASREESEPTLPTGGHSHRTVQEPLTSAQ